MAESLLENRVTVYLFRASDVRSGRESDSRRFVIRVRGFYGKGGRVGFRPLDF